MRLRFAALIDALCKAGDADGRSRSPEVLRRFRDLIDYNTTKSADEQRRRIAAAATDLFDTRPIPAPFNADPLSPNYHSAGLDLTKFPPEIIYLFRATQILRAITEQGGFEWSLAHEWRDDARRLLRRKGRDQRNWVLES